MSEPSFDRRVTPARTDLAAAKLKGIVAAPRYAAPLAYRVIASHVPMRREPDPEGALDTELVYGEMLDIYDLREGWAWGQAVRDSYVGYVPASALMEGTLAPTHRVSTIRSFRYPSASIKVTPLGFLPYGAEVAVEAFDGRFAKTDAGYVFAEHLVPLSENASDPVAEARRFLGIPYLWGGKSSLGIDCSGLVQSIHRACGVLAPRDSDMQEKALGEEVAIPNDPAHYRRGDLLFWPGHVAMAEGDGMLIHATAHSMSVISESLAGALARIAAQGHPLRTVRRLTKP